MCELCVFVCACSCAVTLVVDGSNLKLFIQTPINLCSLNLLMQNNSYKCIALPKYVYKATQTHYTPCGEGFYLVCFACA